MNRVDILKAEYKRAINDPIFDNPADYCVLLNLIADELEKLGEWKNGELN